LASWKNKLADAEQAKNSATQNLENNKIELQATEERIEAARKEVEEKKKAVAELEKLYESTGTDKRGSITDASGKTRSLRKEKNELKNTE
jgi:outer membrane protein TolC